MEKHTLDPNKWIDSYSDYLFNYTIVKVNDDEVAKDLVQETFFSALKAMKNFKGEASERTWLISILKRKIIDYYRKINSKKGKAEVRITYNDDTENEGEWLEERVADYHLDGNAESEMENVELGLAINKCMDRLPEKQATIFKMKTVEGFETEIICKELNITPSNLWVIIHRARLQLMECLEKNWYA
ncbi:MAG: sigma-70 family RNA polymerase sigma factor [Flavobacteriaceae bacterium]|nr:sigma-70 family RNA polymerase sigma factor [Flavobacteriaceae bacterium]MDZ4148037.1 sigma-70 family RNA polymerase sigma factor [Flavobacteriaceae bacterium]